MFEKYLQKGYQPLPIGYLTKYPCVFKNGKWENCNKLGKLKSEPVSKEECELWNTWIPKGCGIGIALGEYSGVIALDFDEDNAFTDKIKSMLPKPPVAKVGSKGFTAFFKYNGEKNKKFKENPSDRAYSLEILSTGNQTVLPPSFHPATQKPYYWIDDVSLLDVEKEDLPSLPEGFVEKVEALLGQKEQPSLHVFPKTEDKETSVDDVRDALSFINPDCVYDEWIHIGMGLKHCFGDSGFEIWNNWSRGGSKYPKRGNSELLKKWNSFRGQGITIATLFHDAKLNGYKTKYNQEDVIYDIPFLEKIKLEASPVGAKERVEEGFPVQLCREATGLVGKIQKWIEDTAMFPQPVLALGAAISAVGIIYAHKIEGQTGSRTNMYCLGVAPSGSGKDHPRKCVNALLDACGQRDLIGGKLTSSPGVLKSLRDGQGKRILQPDEMGRLLKSMNSKYASSHLSGITTLLMELFTSSNTTYYGLEYANHDGKQERKDIEQPCLVLHASTVPEHLYEAMTGTDAVDGFLSRWLIFEEKGYPDFKKPSGSVKDVPQDILDDIARFYDKTEVKGDIAQLGIYPREIPFSPEADRMAQEFCKSMRKRAQQKHDEGDKTHAIWTRTFEHATKLALVGHEGNEITENVMKWAIEVATFCSQYLCDQAAANISDNEHEKNVKNVLKIIKQKGKGGITKSDLVRKTHKLNGKERNDIIMSLIESEQIVAEQVQAKTKPVTKYTANV